MSFRYVTEKYYHLLDGGEELKSATLTEVIGPVDISNFDRFALTYINSHSTIAFQDLKVQVSTDPVSAATADVAPFWVEIPTATLPSPSALGATATVLAPAINNAYKYLRIMGKVASTASNTIFQLNITGFQRA